MCIYVLFYSHCYTIIIVLSIYTRGTPVTYSFPGGRNEALKIKTFNLVSTFYDHCRQPLNQWQPPTIFPRTKQPVREADHLHLSGAEVKKARKFTSAHPYVLIA
jgi:hypothetical protein